MKSDRYGIKVLILWAFFSLFRTRGVIPKSHSGGQLRHFFGTRGGDLCERTGEHINILFPHTRG